MTSRHEKRLSPKGALMTAYAFLNRDSQAIIQDLSSDPSLIEDLIAAGGAGAKSDYRKMLTNIFPLTAKLRPDLLKHLLNASCVGSTLSLLPQTMTNSARQSSEASVFEAQCRAIAYHLSFVMRQTEPQNFETEELLHSTMKALMFRVAMFTHPHETTRTILEYFHHALPEKSKQLFSEKLFDTMLSEVGYIYQLKHLAQENEDIDKISQNIVALGALMLQIGANPNSQAWVNRNGDQIEKNHVLLSVAWQHRREVPGMNELTAILMDAGADLDELLQRKTLSTEDREVLLAIPFVRRHILGETIGPKEESNVIRPKI